MEEYPINCTQVFLILKNEKKNFDFVRDFYEKSIVAKIDQLISYSLQIVNTRKTETVEVRSDKPRDQITRRPKLYETYKKKKKINVSLYSLKSKKDKNLS
jgi:hypothetical protein